MDLGIAGKTALITASSKGLGKATAMALAMEGAKVVITARNEDALDATAHEIAQAGGNVHYLVNDVTDPVGPAYLVAETIDRFGGLDILVANAGGPPLRRAMDVDDESILEAINANMQSSIRLVHSAVPHMRAQGWGRICLMTSRTVKEPMPTNALSNLARAGLWAWAKTAAQDLYHDGITMNTICPGNHATDRMKDMPDETGPFGDPMDFGKAAAFLCSDSAKFINATSLVVDGGAAHAL